MSARLEEREQLRTEAATRSAEGRSSQRCGNGSGAWPVHLTGELHVPHLLDSRFPGQLRRLRSVASRERHRLLPRCCAPAHCGVRILAWPKTRPPMPRQRAKTARSVASDSAATSGAARRSVRRARVRTARSLARPSHVRRLGTRPLPEAATCALRASMQRGISPQQAVSAAPSGAARRSARRARVRTARSLDRPPHVRQPTRGVRLTHGRPAGKPRKGKWWVGPRKRPTALSARRRAEEAPELCLALCGRLAR